MADLHFAHVKVKDVLTTFEVRHRNLDLHVKSTRTQQRSAQMYTRRLVQSFITWCSTAYMCQI